MDNAFVSPTHIVVAGPICGSATVRQLVFPYPVSVDLLADGARYAARGLSRPLHVGRWLVVPALARFDLHLATGAAVRIQVDARMRPLPGRAQRFGPIRTACTSALEGGDSPSVGDKALTRSLARAVFLHPGLAWTREAFAALMHLSSDTVSRRLFSEGESFRDVVRAYRLCRLLCDLPTHRHIDNALAEAYGFNYRYALEDAVYASFSLSLGYLCTLVSAGEDGGRKQRA